MAVMGKALTARGAWTWGVLKRVTLPWFVTYLRLQYQRCCLPLMSSRRTEAFYHLLQLLCEPRFFYHTSSPFPTNAHLCQQFGEFLPVRNCFFHLVGEEAGPCRGLRLAFRGSWADQMTISVHTLGDSGWQLERGGLFFWRKSIN